MFLDKNKHEVVIGDHVKAVGVDSGPIGVLEHEGSDLIGVRTYEGDFISCKYQDVEFVTRSQVKAAIHGPLDVDADGNVIEKDPVGAFHAAADALIQQEKAKPTVDELIKKVVATVKEVPLNDKSIEVPLVEAKVK